MNTERVRGILREIARLQVELELETGGYAACSSIALHAVPGDRRAAFVAAGAKEKGADGGAAWTELSVGDAHLLRLDCFYAKLAPLVVPPLAVAEAPQSRIIDLMEVLKNSLEGKPAPVAKHDEEQARMARERDTEPRVPGCKCHMEIGDSACPVHPCDECVAPLSGLEPPVEA